jgi:hypothetical protein
MRQHFHSDRAFSLVEITLAIGITAFCLLALFGLLPVGLTSNQNAIEQTAAAGWATAVAADLRSTPRSANASPFYKINVPAPGGATKYNIFLNDDGVRVNTATDARYRANVWFYPPTANLRAATVVRILITWPALADPINTQDPKNYSGSFEVVTAMDRN